MIIGTRIKEHMTDLLRIRFMQQLNRLPTVREEQEFFYRNRGPMEDIIKALDSITVNLSNKLIEEVKKREKNSRN